MELLRKNYVNTTTAIVVNSNTDSAQYIMNPDTSFQFVSSGFNNDLTTVTLRINFTETLTVSRIAMVGMNLKEFDLFYNGVTANAFALTTSAATTTSKWTSNSETSMFMQCTPVACTSVSLDMKKTMVADAEKALGYFVVSQERIDFSRIPSAKNYNPVIDTEEVVHKLSDGNTRIQVVADRWRANVKLEYISESFRNSLRTIYNLHDGLIFVPFGTTTAWDAVIFPCVWQGPFDFYKFSDNAPATGFEGTIKLWETTP
jgi:hypothetical protein